MAKRSIIPVFVPHAGCPCQCVFCNQRAITGVSSVDAKAIIEEGLSRLSHVGELAEKPEVAFYGGSFTAIPLEIQDRLLKTAYDYIQNGKISSVRISTRPDAIDEDSLLRLKQYGVTVIELGAQSMCDEVLAAAKRGHTAEDTVKASRLIKKHGFKLILQTMAGLPKDNSDTVKETATRVSELLPDGVRIYPVAVLPNTPLFDSYKSGEYIPLTVEAATQLCADMLEIFMAHNIPVIRLGLNPTEELLGQVAAGAYHPAMGELVYGEVFYRHMRSVLMPYKAQHGEAVFLTPENLISKAVGQKRRNITRLESEFRDITIKVKANDVQAFTFTPTLIS